MKQEDKDLLLKDLCARLLYGVKVEVLIEEVEYDAVVHGVYADETVFVEQSSNPNKVHCIDVAHVSEVKPYLFPLSSMTEEQKEEFYKFFEEGITESANETRQWLRTKRADEIRRPITIAYVMVHELVIDWLNKNHFDYRGLIEKGLAIDATNLKIY